MARKRRMKSNKKQDDNKRMKDGRKLSSLYRMHYNGLMTDWGGTNLLLMICDKPLSFFSRLRGFLVLVSRFSSLQLREIAEI